jgi:predicted ATPase/class 3 adenylate cyclase
MQCPSCNANVPGGSKFCEQCGTALPRPCLACGHANSAGANFCSNCGASLAAGTIGPAVSTPSRQALTILETSSAERRQLTVMFCDMVGSTALSTRLDPEEQREIIDAFQTFCSNGIKQFGGMVAGYRGDGVLAYFGYPAAHENDAERAIRAGIEIIGNVKGSQRFSDVKLQARIGIASGVVVVGDLLRDGVTQEIAAVGETTNLAARLQSLAEPNALLICSETHRLVGALFEYNDLGQHTLRGFAEPVHARQVLRVSKIESRFEALHQSRASALVGRDEEFDLLVRRWAQAKAGEGCVIHITGEPGIGKSRLAHALVDCLEGVRHTCVQCHCSPYHTDSALHPVINHLLRAAGIEYNDEGAERLAKLEALLQQSNSSLSETVPLLAPLLSIPLSERYTPLVLSPRRRKERTLAALIDQFAVLAIHQPVLMVFEDAHWIDPTSLELLSLTIDRVARLPVLLIITARPEFSPPWPTHRHISVMALGRLGHDEGAALVHRIAKDKAFPTEVLKEIIDHTDGVPLFIEELTKTVLESGLLQEADDCYLLTGPMPPLAIPSTLHASLLARLDRLASVKDVAQIGAVMGREFSYSLIAAVSGIPEHELAAALAKLVAAELIFQRGVPPDASYLFKHALVQDAAYASLLRRRRSALHAAIVKKLVAGSVSGTEVKPEVLAYHCAAAGMAEEAVRHYLQASEQSVARSALAEAAVLLDKALGQAARLPTGPARERKELEVQCALGAVLTVVKGYAAAETGKTYARARHLWDRLDRPPEFLRVARGQWMFHVARSELREAQSIAADLVSFSREHGDKGGLILGNHALGYTHLFGGELLSARAKLEEALRLYDSTAHGQLFRQLGLDTNAIALAHLGLNLSLLGYPDQALVRAGEAISQARQHAHTATMEQCLALSARTASILGDEVRLAHWVQGLRALTQEHDYPVFSAQVPVYEGELELTRGDANAAVTLMRQGLYAYRATGATSWSSHFASLLGEALAQDGKLDEALSLMDDYVAALGNTGMLWCASDLHRRRGQLLLKSRVPDFAGAEAEFLQAMDIARGQSAKLWELRAAVNLARLWHDQGRSTDARHLLSPIYAWFTEGFDSADLKGAKLLLGELSA